MWWGEVVQVALTGIKGHPGSLLEAVTLRHELNSCLYRLIEVRSTKVAWARRGLFRKSGR